jgi:iron complex outermembrane recepter protein
VVKLIINKKMKKLGMTLMGILASCYSYGQFTINGKVNSASGEALMGATIVLDGSTNGAVADGDGNYRLSDLPKGTYVLKANFLGYEEQVQKIELTANATVNFSLEENVLLNDAVTIYATRANENTPTTFENVSKEEIAARNLGQDVPYILRMTPSMVVNSDAGAGVGYTGMRIRGSDASRINVTVNGIPINDSESHGTFWVNMPDFASSVNNLQIQRGVGTSTNGAGAFGATISMQTGQPSKEAFGQVDNSFGSFNTRKHTVMYNTGLIQDRWAFEGRLSQIASDGFIDRSASDLKSYYLSGGFYGDKTTVKAITFGGKEVTQQAWYGTPEVKLRGGDSVAINNLIDYGGEYGTAEQIANLKNSNNRKFNYYTYDNEVDNYQQDHYQLHISQKLNEQLNVNLSGHYTYGRGYYEQFRNQDSFGDYGLENVVIGDSTIETTDLIRRRWLDNRFYGITGSINYQASNWSTTLGGGYNFYDGDHFGEIIWSQYASNSNIREHYYDNYGRKSDLNLYSKTNYQATKNLNLFVDLQVRMIDYHTKGIDNDRSAIKTGGNYQFFNPKFGATYEISRNTHAYVSYAVANREPVRTDFVDAPAGKTPKHETLRNLEAGYRTSTSNFSFAANYFLMNYKNELVATGAVNDVGSSLRVNVNASYRTGIELVGGAKFSDLVQWQGNIAFSQNKIKKFTEVVYDYAFDFGTEGYEVKKEHKDTDIAFSPNWVASSVLTFTPAKGLTLEFLSKYVSDQYLDNTSDKARMLNSYFTNDLQFGYSFSVKSVKQIKASVMINNFMNVKYEANGYTWGYLYAGDLYQQNNYYPQAGTNFLAGLSLRF